MKLMYYVVYGLWYAVSLLPLRVLYVLSDVLFFFVFYVMHYRRRTVWVNLVTSFPEKAEEDKEDIERRFYRWFCDYLVETLKMFSMSEKQMRRRMRFEGMDELNALMSQGRSVTVYLGHYCNWEWVSSLPLHIPSQHIAAQLYHPLESALADRLFLYARGRYHAHSLEMKEAFQILAHWKKEGKASITGYISDQVPGFSSMHYWPTFLNHETPTYTGAERIARVLDTAVYYFDIYRPRRGYYVARPVLLCTDTKGEPKFSLTERYYRLLEQSIQRAPAFWLWSHNRWKRTWDDFVKYFPDEAEQRRILNKL